MVTRAESELFATRKFIREVMPKLSQEAQTFLQDTLQESYTMDGTVQDRIAVLDKALSIVIEGGPE